MVAAASFRAPFTAESTRSWSISTSSGSTHWGSISTDRTSRAPFTVTFTMPPPEDAENS